jgi:hypothetical protein
VRIDLEDLRRHYAELSDEELEEIEAADLTEAAKAVYEAEFARRKLPSRPEAEEAGESDDGSASINQTEDIVNALREFDIDTGQPPDWLEDAACACSFATHPRNIHLPMAVKARAILRRAGIPFYITMDQDEDNAPQAQSVPQYPLDGMVRSGLPQNATIRVMVPGALAFHATSILDLEIFNAEKEAEWRNHFEELSDAELNALDPEILCLGLRDLMARLRRAYDDEIARRESKSREAGAE